MLLTLKFIPIDFSYDDHQLLEPSSLVLLIYSLLTHSSHDVRTGTFGHIYIHYSSKMVYTFWCDILSLGVDGRNKAH